MKRRIAVGIVGAALAVGLGGGWAAEPKASTIGGVTQVAGMQEVRIQGVGLVVGLDDTGADPEPSPLRTILTNDMRLVAK